MENEVESKLKNYLSNLKDRRNLREADLNFCVQHNFHEEARCIRKELDILAGEYVEIHNKVLGIFF